MNKDKQMILVVDDIASNIEILAGLLRPEYDIKIALNGQKALKIAESDTPPDLILLDIMMPEMDGFEVCHRLKQNPKTAKIPIIFVTAKNEAIDEEKGLELGAADYLTKPVTPCIVKARVRNHLQLASAMSELKNQNEILKENLKLREEVEQINRHDLKGPLTIIMGVPDFMSQDNNLTKSQLRIMEILEKTSYKMLNMINRSLDLAKMEKGKYQLEPTPVDIIKVLRLVINQLNPIEKRKKLTTSLYLNNSDVKPDDSFIIQGEESLFYCLFQNLIKNAMEASPTEREIIISISKTENPTIEIKNHGEVPAEIQARFFDKYVTHGKRSGTGLGTYSAKLMAKTLGGDLRFTTSQKQGTSLFFEVISNK